MKKIFLITISVFFAFNSFAQLSTVSNDKPLGYLNPALQNYNTEKGVVSASYVLNPLVKEEVPGAYLALAEFKVSDAFRVGIHASQQENRLSKSGGIMGYASYRLELEKGNYLILGADIGSYSDQTKVAEFNKVFAPNQFFIGTDSSLTGTTTGLDFGFGVAYSYSGFTAGICFSKLNKPEVYLFPYEVFEITYSVIGPGDTSFSYQLQDTAVAVEKGNFGLESNVNLMYEWNANSLLKVTHAVHFGNIDAAGFDYFGFQNFAEIKNRHSVGLGAFFNGETGFIGSLGYGITEDLKLGVTTFVQKDMNYDIASKEYVSDGYKPSFEANLRFEF